MKKLNFFLIFNILLVLSQNLNIFAMEDLSFSKTDQFCNFDRKISIKQSAVHDPIEDHYLVSEKSSSDPLEIYGVFDGHGANDKASDFLAWNTARELKSHPLIISNPRQAIYETFVNLNNSIFERNITSGSTANVVLKFGRKIYVANVGDSRSVLCKDGKAIALSQDQRPSNPTEMERIINAGGFLSFFSENTIEEIVEFAKNKILKIFNTRFNKNINITQNSLDIIKNFFTTYYSQPINSQERIHQIREAKEKIILKHKKALAKTNFTSFHELSSLLILREIIDEAETLLLRFNGILLGSRSFGDKKLYRFNPEFNSAEPEITEFNLTPEDQYLVIASDGLWDFMENQEVIDIIKTSFNPELAQSRLIEQARARGSIDDITIMIVDLR